jgi:hypothetical protein
MDVTKAATFSQAEAALPEAKAIFEGLATVAYIGVTPIGDGFWLKVLLLDPPRSRPPATVSGVPVQVKVTGESVYSKCKCGVAVSATNDEVDRFRNLLERLLEWEGQMGGYVNPVWDDVRRALGRCVWCHHRYETPYAKDFCSRECYLKCVESALESDTATCAASARRSALAPSSRRPTAPARPTARPTRRTSATRGTCSARATSPSAAAATRHQTAGPSSS